MQYSDINSVKPFKVSENTSWQYLKEKAKETLQSEEGKRIYGCRKSDSGANFRAHEECVWYAQNAFKRQKESRNGCRYHVYDDESEKIWSQQEGKAFEFSFQKQKTQEFTKNNEFLCFYIRAKNRVFSQTLTYFYV